MVRAHDDGQKGLKWKQRNGDGGAKCSVMIAEWENEKETHLKSQPAEICLTLDEWVGNRRTCRWNTELQSSNFTQAEVPLQVQGGAENAFI